MATYTGDAQAKPNVGMMVWLAVASVVIAAVLVIALVVTQGGSSVPDRPVAGQTQGHSIGVPAGKGHGPPQTIPLGNGVCHQCAP
jgi:hypothetical protein